MVGFTRKKVSSHTLGEKLKEIRENANVSLSEIAKATKVRKIHLEKLEDGRFDELPPEVYVRGFLTSYAVYLGIEPDDVIRLYEKERGIQTNIKKLQQPKEKKAKFKIPSLVITPNIFAAAFFILLVFSGMVYFYKEVGKFSQEPRLVIIQPIDNISVDGNSVEIIGISEEGSQVTINGQSVFVNDKGEFKEKISLQRGVNELEIRAINRFDNEASKKISISADFEVQLAEEGVDKVMGVQDDQEPKKLELEVRVEDSPTWISVQIDNAGIQNGTMLPGTVQTFEANEQISITSGKANKTMITLNGESLGALSEEAGVVRDVVFKKDAQESAEDKQEGNEEQGSESIEQG